MFSRTVRTPKTNTDMAALPCKKKGQKVAIEASGICKAQTETFPSTTLKSDKKYDYLQNSKNSKTVYKHARNAMQK